MILLAVDPGIDLAAAAVYDVAESQRRRGSGYARAAFGFLGVERVRTVTTDPLPQRCEDLFRWIGDLSRERRAWRVVIEVPHTEGVYRGKQSRQLTKGSLNAPAIAKLNRAIAALTLGASESGAEVIEYPAKYPLVFADKETRHGALRGAILSAGKPELKGNADERDAAFLGLHYITTELRP